MHLCRTVFFMMVMAALGVQCSSAAFARAEPLYGYVQGEPTAKPKAKPKDAVSSSSKKASPVACTLEAKQCPDGHFVTRKAPDCAFEACKKRDEQESGADQSLLGEHAPAPDFVEDVRTVQQDDALRYPADKYNRSVHMIMPVYHAMESIEMIAQRRDVLRDAIADLAKKRDVEVQFFKYANIKAGFPDILITCPDSFLAEIKMLPDVGTFSYPPKDGIKLEPLRVHRFF
jgi:hypothetical protein